MQKTLEKDCFEPYGQLAKSMELKRKIHLRPNAKPTLFEKPANLKSKSPMTSETPAPKKRRNAIEKCKRSQVSIVDSLMIMWSCFIS